MFKVNNKNTRMASMTSFWCFIVNFEHNSHLCLVFQLETYDQKNLFTCRGISELPQTS